MSTFWRQAGLTYVQFSSICARITRQCLKSEFVGADKVKAAAPVSGIKITSWEGGKPKTVIEQEQSKTG